MRSHRIRLTREQLLQIVDRLEQQHHRYPDVQVTIRRKTSNPEISSDIVSVEIDNRFEKKDRFHFHVEENVR